MTSLLKMLLYLAKPKDILREFYIIWYNIC